MENSRLVNVALVEWYLLRQRICTAVLAAVNPEVEPDTRVVGVNSNMFIVSGDCPPTLNANNPMDINHHIVGIGWLEIHHPELFAEVTAMRLRGVPVISEHIESLLGIS